jgi:histidinol-phosphate aminotransferase
VAERSRLAIALAAFGLHVYPSEANLLLVRFPDAAAAHAKLAAAGVAVRAFGAAGPLAGCLRITVGTAAETDALLRALAA